MLCAVILSYYCYHYTGAEWKFVNSEEEQKWIWKVLQWMHTLKSKITRNIEIPLCLDPQCRRMKKDKFIECRFCRSLCLRWKPLSFLFPVVPEQALYDFAKSAIFTLNRLSKEELFLCNSEISLCLDLQCRHMMKSKIKECIRPQSVMKTFKPLYDFAKRFSSFVDY